jgi:acetyl/propionyl-CoA carboxylase alpha subunit
VRVYAEDPAHGFLPSTGTLSTFIVPDMAGVRNDVAVETGSQVSPEYDPMLAKLIVHAKTRNGSLALLADALEGYLVGGVATNLGFLRWLAAQPVVRAGQTTTDFLDKHFRPAALVPADGGIDAALAAAGASQMLPCAEPPTRPAQALAAWRASGLPRQVRFASFDEPVLVERLYTGGGGWRARLGDREAVIKTTGGGVFSIDTGSRQQTFTAWAHGERVWIAMDGIAMSPQRVGPPTDEAKAGHRHPGEPLHGSIEAPMSGTIVKVNVAVGDAVAPATVVIVMEAMKMEHAIAAPYAGIVSKLHAQAGRSVNAGDVLAEIEEG